MALIENYAAFGASIMQYVHYESNPIAASVTAGELQRYTRNSMFSAIKSQNIKLGFRRFSIGGNVASATLQAVQDNINSVPIDYPCVIHTAGNDTSSKGPFADWTQTQIDDLRSTIRQTYETVLNSGRDLVAIPLTFGEYAENGDRNLNQDRRGLVNQEIIVPLIRELTPEKIDPATNQPYIRWHEVSGQADLENRYFYDRAIDGIHPNWDTGVITLQNELVRGLKSIPGYEFTPFPSGRKVHFSCSTELALDAAPVTNYFLSGGATLNSLIDEDANVLTGSSVSLSGWSDPGAGGAIVSGPYFTGVTHFNTIANRVFASAPTAVNLTIPEFAGMAAVAKISATRLQGGTDRVALYSIGEESGLISAGALPPEVLEIPFIFDENGSVTINAAANIGTQFFYLSGLTIELIESVISNIRGGFKQSMKNSFKGSLRRS